MGIVGRAFGFRGFGREEIGEGGDSDEKRSRTIDARNLSATPGSHRY